jgi:predicted MFS family arabinose efflux permease
MEVERRLAADNNYLSDDFDLKFVWQALKDWKIWVNMILTVGLFTPLYSIALFLPTIVRDLGYSNSTAQLMSAPPYVSACVMTILGSYAADRLKQRGLLLLGYQLIAILGFALLATSKKPHIQYAGSFFAAAGM